MLTIRKDQMQVFEQAARLAFEDEMVAHSRKINPPLCKVLGEDGLRKALRAAIDRTAEYRLVLRGPIRLFIEACFMFGSSFDTDPQYPWASEILRRKDEEMARAEALWNRMVDYQKKVAGQERINVRRALEELLALTRKTLPFGSDDFETGMQAEMRRIFPQKVEYVGHAGMLALVRAARSVSGRYRLPSPRGEALLSALMLAFGHGCAADPLYPWIGQTLTDPRIVDAPARAERLEKKAVTWLEHVLAGPRAGDLP